MSPKYKVGDYIACGDKWVRPITEITTYLETPVYIMRLRNGLEHAYVISIVDNHPNYKKVS